jgi:hypothetical protein
MSLSGVVMNALLLSSLLLCPGADDKPPAQAKLPLGRDTTFVTGPLDKQGYIDYEAALNAELSKGVTPENNANALLVVVFGPAPEGGDGFPLAYYKWLDVAVPPKNGDYFVGSGKYFHDKLGLSGEKLQAVYDFQGRATKWPWAAKECPPLAEWLKANEKPLALAAEAVKRPEYFNPLCSRRAEGEPSNLIGTLLPSVQKCRELASALTCRAMLRVKEGKYDEAWQDLLACHRLGRLITRGATLIESLVGIAISQIASNATLAYLQFADLTSEQVLDRLADLEKLPRVMPMADKIGTGERMMGLDALQNMRRGGNPAALLGDNDAPTAEQLKALGKLDWTPTMQAMNKWYDRMSAAMRLKDRAAREKEFDRIDAELAAAKKDTKKLEKLIKDSKDEKDAKAIGKEVATTIGNVLMGLLAPAVRKVQGAEDRMTQVQNNLRLAFAMAAYHKDSGRYPAELRDLAPKYLAAVPGDVFSGKPLVYKPSGKGYLFYSVGQNGKDDGGRWYDDTPPGDDPGVRMPLPELKK